MTDYRLHPITWKNVIDYNWLWLPHVCRALGIRLSDWCCSVSMVWVQFPSKENKKLSAQKLNSNTGIKFSDTCIYNIYICLSLDFPYETR
jgi:hypothetical protein